MKNYYIFYIISVVAGISFRANAQQVFSLSEASRSLPHLFGKKNNAAYPYVTAGDRLYAIGDQSGNFPAIGFHVPGEMGGVWQQPIKLLNGFYLKMTDTKTSTDIRLDSSASFITYPFTTSFLYVIPQEQLSIVRTQFVPDGKPVLVVEYAFTNNSATDKDFKIEFAIDVNLMPVWLGERTGMIDSTDEVVSFDKKTNTLWLKDKNNPWYAGISSGKTKTEFAGTEKTAYHNKGLAASLITTLNIQKGKTVVVHYYISGSLKEQHEIQRNIASTSADLAALFKAKKERYKQLDNNAALNIPDMAILEAYQWGKYSSDWLVRDVPGLGRGMSAGLPDYPWFFSNDQASTFNALVGTVQPDIFFSSWKMIKQLSDKTNDSIGRIIHEASSNGAVYDKGRMEESQLHIITAWNIFRWTGNAAFLKENYAYGEKIWAWLQQHDTNHNGYIEGYGGVEIKGLDEEMLDVQVQTQIFLEVMSKMAMAAGDRLASADFQLRATKLKQEINADWWVPEENRYADFISSREKAIEIIDTALATRVHPGRNEWAMKKLTDLKDRIKDNRYTNKGYVVYYNGSGILPVGEGMADTLRAMQVLNNIHRFTNKYGLYITGIERPDNLSIDEGSFRHDAEFNYNRAVMPGATAGIVVSACRYGRTDTALAYMHTLLNSFNYATPGTMYEVSPDYGMFVQAWNIVGFNIPLIQYFFGVDPMASQKQVFLRPNFPAEWGSAEIKNLIIGNTRLSVEYQKAGEEMSLTIRLDKPGWTVKLEVPQGRSVMVNGKKVQVQNRCLTLTGKQNMVKIAQ